MKLLNKYQSRVFQFALDLMARLEYRRELGRADLNALARDKGLDYAGQVSEPLEAAGLLEQEDGCLRLGPDLRAPRLPASTLERDYLSFILNQPEADRFLTRETRETLQKNCDEPDFFAPVQCNAPKGDPSYPDSEDFQTILEAIRRHYLIHYIYRTRLDDTPRTAEGLPWKVECSAFDRRWWIILYVPSERRTIKARLDNLRDVRLLGPTNVPPSDIDEAMDRLLEEEPVVLEVRRTKGALERCFLTFEDQLFEQTRQLSEDRFRLAFRFYRFDRSEILQRLLYLGPAVELLEPDSLRADLKKLVEQAISTENEKTDAEAVLS